METLYEALAKLRTGAKEVAPISQRRFVQEPDTSTLTSEQSEAFKGMVEFVENPEEKLFLLEGYAGTGKTYLISMFVEWYLATKNKKVAMTAPTNKAVKVLKGSGAYQDPNLHYSTIHSLLGLKERIDGYGNQLFVQDNMEDASAGEYDLIVIDEVSMLQDDLLVGSKVTTGLFEYARMFNLKLLFVGDPAQIPPIGRENCLPFREEDRQKYGIKRYTLTDIVRQSKGNPIIQVTLEVRNALGRDVVLPIREDNYNPDNLTGVFFMDYELKDEFNMLLREYFTSEEFKNDADFAKIVAYRNATVDAFNQKVRRMIYGKDVGKICIGEKLIANKPIISDLDDSVIFTVNDEFEVVDFQVTEGNYKGAELTYYEATVEEKNFMGSKTKVIKIIHERSAEDYELILEHLKELALQERKGSWEAAAKWKDFFAIQKFFADVNYNYAITGHKSQGSTYANVFVLESDIDVNRKIKERNRIKYTAFTRPSERLFIVS